MLIHHYQMNDAELTRLEMLWKDLEVVSEALQDPPCLEYRGVRTGQGYYHPAVRTGAEALKALIAKDFVTFGELVYRDVEAALKERAVDEVEAENDLRREDAA